VGAQARAAAAKCASSGVVVKLEVRRADDGYGGRTRSRGMLGERDRVGCRLGAAMHGDVQPAGARRQEQVGEPFPLRDGEQDPFARRPHGEKAVQAAGSEEVGEGTDGAVVEGRAPVAQRRHSCGQSTSDHGRTLWFGAAADVRAVEA